MMQITDPIVSTVAGGMIVGLVVLYLMYYRELIMTAHYGKAIWKEWKKRGGV